jgi:hypothetical protein
MYCRVLNWMSSDVSEVRAASIIRAIAYYYKCVSKILYESVMCNGNLSTETILD